MVDPSSETLLEDLGAEALRTTKENILPKFNFVGYNF